MRFIVRVLLLLCFPLSVYSFTDESHHSKTFGADRFFRVFTPVGYDTGNNSKRYPVIYYFHGCGGSYRSSGTYSYKDYGLVVPTAVGRSYNKEYEYPNNADFENYSNQREVIIVSVDGKIDGIPGGCGVYFPSQAENWIGNYYNFSVYIRELFEVVDSRYNTKKGAQFRAISGLSMGGNIALWVAAANPHLFSSASEFCHSPNFYDVGAPAFQTTIDVQQLWRNFNGLPFRHSTNDRDYLRFYSEELSAIYSGAGFENEFYLADFCKHHAARVDLQFDFHLSHFSLQKKDIPCFSYINLYPKFEIWGYELASSKTGNGWIYLHSVTKNGLGLYTRKRLPWGKALSTFGISLTTPAIYIPNGAYSISRYDYQNNIFTTQEVTADSKGRLSLYSSGGMGEEIGIIGKELQPPVLVLTDTINENIYLNNCAKTALSFDVVNLSSSVQKVDFWVSTKNSDLLSILSKSKRVILPARSKVRVDSLFVCRGTYLANYKNKGYIKISSSIEGVIQDRDCLLQVTVKNQSQHTEPFAIKIFDSTSERLPLFRYVWGEWKAPLTSGIIIEGSGNGNGKAEMGETFSIWIQPSSAFDPLDTKTWHPVVPINRSDNPDIEIVKINQHIFNTGRPLLSAEIRLNRRPTKENPVRIPIQSEFLKVEHLENDCHRNVADNFGYFYDEILIYEDGTAGIEIRSNKYNQ